MKYTVRTYELCWYSCYYTVEADSEEEAKELVESGEADLEYSDWDATEKIDFESITK